METDPLKTGLPENLEAERLLIGLAMIEPMQTKYLVTEVSPDDFSRARHQQIWHVVTALALEGSIVSELLVAEQLRQRGNLESAGGLIYLSELASDGVLGQVTGAEEYIRLVREKAILRRVLYTCRKLSYQCLTDSAGAVLAEFETLNRSVSEQMARTTGNGVMSVGQTVESAGGPDQVFHAATRGVQTPWPALNSLTLGLHRGQMIVLVGRTGRGKSAMSCQIANYALLQQNTGAVALFSLEMRADAILRRMAMAKADVNANVVRRGDTTREERQRLSTALAELTDSSLWLSEKMRVTVSSINRSLQHIQARGNRLGLVIVDYLQLMSHGARTENRQQEIAAISRGLKQTAVEFDVPVLVLCQYNREADRADSRPMLHHIRESGAVGHDADAVLLMHEPEGTGESGWKTDLIVEKQREGPTGTVHLWFDRAKTRFVDA